MVHFSEYTVDIQISPQTFNSYFVKSGNEDEKTFTELAEAIAELEVLDSEDEKISKNIKRNKDMMKWKKKDKIAQMKE